MKLVHIVHHIDTEGPLHEPVKEVFSRLENTLGIKLPMAHSEKNLKRLQTGDIAELPSDIQREIQKIIDPHLLTFKTSWAEVDEMLYRIMDTTYRKQYSDSFGGSWIYNWHIMDHVGFETNERRRDIGYGNIFNHYEQIISETQSFQDEVHWHFHPLSPFKEGHISATSYDNCLPLMHQVICRRLIDKKWFPTVNRAAFHSIRPDSNLFMEQWIPFDASNQSLEEEASLQQDVINGRFGDWRNAPSDWSIYHPDIFDWRKPGQLKRYLSRVLNMKTRLRNINPVEIRKAFQLAEKQNSPVYLGITNHDFREMSVEMEEFYEMFQVVAAEYSDIPYKFSGAIEAFRSCIGFSAEEIRQNQIQLDARIEGNVLHIETKNGEVWGAQPYLAIKTVTGQYYHDNLDFGTFKQNYYYTLDRLTIARNMVDKVAIAANDPYGNTSIIHLKFEGGALVETRHHQQHQAEWKTSNSPM